ncbi:MAG: hypothetical protein WED10_10095 [Brumimicrobium sp.]
MKSSLVSYTHGILAVLLAALFLYAGVKKFIPKDRPANPKANLALIESIETNNFENPISFRLAAKMLSTSGFLKMVGVIQIIAGLLIILPKTRMIGLVFLLPITLNIFAFHLFMDNRMDENIETGLFFLVNLLLLLAYYKKIAALIGAKIKIS